MRKRRANPGRQHLPGATPKEQRMYEHILASELERGADPKRAKAIAAATVRSRQKNPAKKRGFISRLGTRLRVIGDTKKYRVKARDTSRCKHRIVKVRGRHDSDAISKARQKLGRNYDQFKVMNRTKRIAVRNAKTGALTYYDLVIRKQAQSTPKGWKYGKHVYKKGKGTKQVSGGNFLDLGTGYVYAKKARNSKGLRRSNVERGGYWGGVFHPYRASKDYSRAIAGETGGKPKRTKSKKKRAAVSKAIATASRTQRGRVWQAKASAARAQQSRTRAAKRKKKTVKKTAKRVTRVTSRRTVARKRKRNVERGGYWGGVFHPYRASSDYSRAIAGETGGKPKRTKSKKKRAAVSKAIATASRTQRGRAWQAKASAARAQQSRTRAAKRKKKTLKKKTVKRSAKRVTTSRKRVTSRRQIARRRNPTRKGMRKAYGAARRRAKGRLLSRTKTLYRRKIARVERHLKKRFRNESPAEIRREFAGSVSGSRDLYFPQGTPQGLAKLGKVISITTEEGTIKPVAGSAWLCSDTKGKLHLGSTTGAPLFDGPRRDFGEVTKIEYEDVKKHLGYSTPTIFFHHVGERNGIRPKLCADGKGGLVFRGGDYRVGPRGLEN